MNYSQTNIQLTKVQNLKLHRSPGKSLNAFQIKITQKTYERKPIKRGNLILFLEKHIFFTKIKLNKKTIQIKNFKANKNLENPNMLHDDPV